MRDVFCFTGEALLRSEGAVERGEFSGTGVGTRRDVSDGNDDEKKQTRRRRHAKGIGRIVSDRVKGEGRRKGSFVVISSHEIERALSSLGFFPTLSRMFFRIFQFLFFFLSLFSYDFVNETYKINIKYQSNMQNIV